jgi:hypothetical protein
MRIITLSHRTIVTQARNFREFRLLQANNYSGNALSKYLQMWADWQEVKDVLTAKSTKR